MTARMTDTLSVVVPVFDVAEYLSDFLSSLDAQGARVPNDIVFVDDGSTDAGADIVQEWIEAHRPSARLIRTENRGVSAARNTGLDTVTGSWVLFLDPDDVLAPGYFATLDAFFASHPDVDLVATNLLRLQEPDHVLRDNHPLRFRFAGGTRVAELEDDLFVMNAASVAFPVEAVRASGSRFRTGLHASEDALFVIEYLLSLGRPPRGGFVADAKYGYRKRAARTSAVDRYRSDPSTYTVRFREGYAPLLEATAARRPIPSWLQSIVLYEMQWLLPVQMDPQRYAKNLDEAQRTETLEGLRACLRHVSDERLLRYDASALPLESRLFIQALTGRPLWDWVAAYATTPRGWRKNVDVVVYSVPSDSRLAPDVSACDLTTWAPDYFGQSSLLAHRFRAPQRVHEESSRRVVWPRAGETLAQTQDRDRRRMAESRVIAVPANEGDAYVQRTRAWAPDPRALRREIRRRSIWSKDAMIGRLLRPGRSILIEHSAERATVSSQLFMALESLTSTVQASPRDGADAPGALKFGSLVHRIARARARAIVTTHTTGRPSPRARLRGSRALVVDGHVSKAEALAIRRFQPDLVVTPHPADIERLEAVGIPASDVLLVANDEVETIAHSLASEVGMISRTTSEGGSNRGA